MGDYTEFINKIKGDFRGTNFIEYNDLGGEIYISFKTLLYFLDEYVNLESNGKSIVSIDWESDKPYYAFSTTISTNLKKCYIYNDYVGTTDGSLSNEGIATFQAFRWFEGGENSEFSKKNQDSQEQAGTVLGQNDHALFPQIGNINYIYLNIGYISEIINKDVKDQTNDISIKTLLQTICDDLNKALGGINDFQVISDPDEGIVTIVDFNQKRIKGLTPPEDTLTTLKVQGLGSFVTSVSAQSSITPEIATMVSVGAQANGNQVGEEATSFSRLSAGLLDRIYPEKKVKNSQPPKLNQNNNTGFESTVSAYEQLISQQKEIPGSVTKISITSDDKTSVENIVVDLYKALMGSFTVSNQSSTSFIPVKLDLTLSGISGLKIFQRFNISSDVLPYTYKDNFNFITTGVSHEVNNNNQWFTKISSLIALKEQPVNQSELIAFPINVPLTPNPPNTTEENKVSPIADKLRTSLTKLGYKEKGKELSNGGDITEELYKYANSLFTKIKAELPSITITVTGGNDKYHQNLGYNSSHKSGTGLDFVISPLDKSNKDKVDIILQKFAVANPKVSFINEYDYKSSAATAGHFHIRASGTIEGAARINKAKKTYESTDLSAYKIK